MPRSTDNSKWIMSGKAERGMDSIRERLTIELLCDWMRKMSGCIARRRRRRSLLSSSSCCPSSSVFLTYVTLLWSLYLSGVGAGLNVTWCFDSNKEHLLNLSCGSASLIRINSVIHGWRNSGQEVAASGCLAPTPDNCMEKYPNVRLLMDTCDGLSSCVISSLELPAPLSSCSQRLSNYVHVVYECFLVDNQTTIINICQNISLRTTAAYIRSPNYPQNYDPNTKCSCLLSTSSSSSSSSSLGGQQRSTEVILQLLDLDLSPFPNERSPFDWLQYGREDRNWGDGHLLGPPPIGQSPLATAPGPIFTASDRVDVDFSTDEQREGRGFWIKVTGLNITSKEEIPVQIECGPYTPPDSRQAISCFEPPRSGELYLSCASYGVINILGVRAGYRLSVNETSDAQLKGCRTKDVVEQSTCISPVNVPVIGDECMRRTTCNPPAPSLANFSSTCGDNANDFVLVDYQCIPDSSQSGNIMNICGDDMKPGTTVVRAYGSGYIVSPLYPSSYPPDSNCFCRLEVMTPMASDLQPAAQIVFYVLDLQLGGASDEELGNGVCSSTTSGCSKGDLLLYGSIGQRPGIGRNFSLEEKGRPIYTGSYVTVVTFQSDSYLEDRGFWIKYVGRSVDGSNAPVIVQCGRIPTLSGPTGTPGRGNSTRPTPDTSSPATSGGDGDGQRPDEVVNSRTGLIVGVTLSVIVIAIALLVLVVVLLHRRRSRIQSAKILNESKRNSWNSGMLGPTGFSSSDRGGSSMGKNGLFARWKRGINKTRTIDKQHSPPFAIFYNDAYKMRDPTLYRDLDSSIRKKRLSPSPTEETVHF